MAGASRRTSGGWDAVFRGAAREKLEAALPRYLATCRWFGGKARKVRAVGIVDAVPLEASRLVLLRVSYAAGDPEGYALPLAFAPAGSEDAARAREAGAEVARVDAGGSRGVLRATDRDPGFARAVLEAIRDGRRFEGRAGEIVAWPSRALAGALGGADADALQGRPLGAEQSNTSLRFGDRAILKLFRRTVAGPNPDLEVGAFLTETARFPHVPPVLGAVEYRPRGAEPLALAILQGFVANEGDAWAFVLGELGGFLERALARRGPPPPAPEGALVARASEPPFAAIAADSSLDAVALLGRRSAELHLALASHPEVEAFRPERFTPGDRRALHVAVREEIRDALALLRRRRRLLPAEARARADLVAAAEGALLRRIAWLAERPLDAPRIRTHGDFHLGQVLRTRDDFVVIDFEGEPARPLAARRAKASPLRDVAGMIRSLHYASHQAVAARGAHDPARERAAAWAGAWYAAASAGYLRAYLEVARTGDVLPQAPVEVGDLLDLHLLEKAMYELSYELNNRPDWVTLPLEGIAAIAAGAEAEEVHVPKKGARGNAREAARRVGGEAAPQPASAPEERPPAKAHGAPGIEEAASNVASPVRPERSGAEGSVRPERSGAAGAAESKGAESKGAESKGAEPKPPPRPRVLHAGGPSDTDLHLWNEGTNHRAYRALGAHPATVDGVAGVSFAVWAPNAEYVSVVGDFNSWDKGAHPLRPLGGSGVWQGFLPGLAEGEIYKYHLRSRERGYSVDKADPFGFGHEVPPRTGSVVRSLEYAWGDADWMRTRRERNSLQSPMNVYEVHLGSWRRVPEDGNRSLTYREAAPLLAEYAAEMGFTHVELLPIMEHPFYGSWGYQTTGYFAPTSRYGTPQDFMHLVDTLHRRGIGVILDWVPSHFPTDEHGLAFFDGTHLFEHADRRQGHHPDWDSFIFNYGRNEVRSFLLSSAMFWLDVFHVDGLRVDAVASMLYLDYSRREGEWIPNVHGGRENLEAIAFMRRLNEVVFGEHPDVQTIAEESTSWPMVSRPIYVGGLGFGMKWDMGWMHDTLSYMRHDPVFRRYHHDLLTFRMMYAFSENFVLALSHDEVVHGKRSLLDKMPGEDRQRFANLRLLLGYMAAQPGKKLLFMGAELAQGKEWSHESSLDWHLLGVAQHAGVQAWVRDLNRLVRSEPALHLRDFDPGGFEWIDCNDAEASVVSLLRHGGPGDPDVVVVANFTPVARHNYRVGVPRGGFWREVLNGDAGAYGGSGIGNLGGQEATPVSAHGRHHSLVLTLPPLSCVFFRSEGAR